jgi:hypothetical protein
MNRRKFQRIEFDGVACLKIGEHNYDCSLIRDLSLTGLFIAGDFQKNGMMNCVVRIFNNKSDDSSVIATGKVVRVNSEGIAIQFTEMTVDNYLLLKQTLSENAEDSLTISSEFPDAPPFEINEK